MKYLFLLHFFFFIFFLTLSTSSIANDVFHQEIYIPIVDNDIVYAKKTAIQDIQKKILLEASKSLIESEIFENYTDIITKRVLPKSKQFLFSIRTLQEEINSPYYYLKLEAKIDEKALKKYLKKLYIPLKDNIWHEITLLSTNISLIQKLNLKEELKQLHIKIIAFYKEESNSISSEEIETLFNKYTQNSIIYFLEHTILDNQQQITLSILMKSFLQPLNIIQVKANNEEQLLKKIKESLSLKTLKVYDYNQKPQSRVKIKVRGIESPYKENIFIKKNLENNTLIYSKSLSSKNREETVYELKLNGSINNFMSYLIEYEDETLQISPFLNQNNEIILQVSVQEVIKVNQTTEILAPESILSEVKSLFEIKTIDPQNIKIYQEKEPNDHSREFNTIQQNQIILGKLSSRSDEDIFRIEQTVESSRTIILDWIKIRKTSLYPELKLYDENFEILKTYRFNTYQKKMRIVYNIPTNISSKFIFIRLNDRIGHITKETGGYKSYQYLLKVH